MRCFFHPDQDAVGICANCGRGLCGESITVVGDLLSCQWCTKALGARFRARTAARSNTKTAFAVSIAMGGVFVAVGLLLLLQDFDWRAVLYFVAFGLLIAGSGLYRWTRLRRIWEDESPRA